jgi:O-antigen ligase
MFGVPAPTLYLTLAVLALFVALSSPLHWLVYLDLGVIGTGDVIVAGARVGPSDILFAALVIGLVLRDRRALLASRLPHLLLWLALGLALSASYLVAPVNQHQLVNPLSTAYQLYRYCWQPILPYFLGVLLLSSPERLRQLLYALTIIGGIVGLGGMLEGARGQQATSAFDTGNSLGGWLIVTIPCAIALLTMGASRRRKLLITLALSCMLGALVYSHSRGSFIGFAGGLAFMSLLLFSRELGLRRLVRLALTAGALLLVAALLKPGLLGRPNVRPFLELTQGEEVSTLEWRREVRWPHFYALAQERPWVGQGTYVDSSLGRRANTPHNGFLAIAVRSGFPALALYVAFGLLAIRNGAHLFRRHAEPDVALAALGLATAVASVLVHNFAESTLVTPREIGRMFFLAAGVLAGLRASWSAEGSRASEAATDSIEDASFATIRQVPRAEAGP